MKHLLFFLLAFPFLASAQILEKQFVATVQFNGFTQINDSLYRGDLIEFRDVLIEGYQPSGVDSGFICLDGTGRAYRVEVVNSFDYSRLNVDLIELDDYDEIPVGVGIVAERYGSTYQIPNGLVNSIGISSILQAKILNHNTEIASSDEDRDSTNELQNLVLIGTVLNITDGNAVDFASLFANYLLKADTAAMLDPYIQGAGIINRVAKFSAARTLTSSNITDDGSRIASLAPLQLAAYDLVSLPTGVTKDMYWVNTQGPAWYQGDRLAYALESTFSRGNANSALYINANGQITQSASYTYNGSTLFVFNNSASNVNVVDFRAGTLPQGVRIRQINTDGRTGLYFYDNGGEGTIISSRPTYAGGITALGGSGLANNAGLTGHIQFYGGRVSQLSTFIGTGVAGTKNLILAGAGQGTGGTAGYGLLGSSAGIFDIGTENKININNPAGAMRDSIRMVASAFKFAATETPIGLSTVYTVSFNRYFNNFTRPTSFGTSAPNPIAIIDANTNLRGSRPFPVLTTAQRGNLAGRIHHIKVITGGTGYTGGTGGTLVPLTITGGGGSGASANGWAYNGVIVFVDVTSEGSGYTSAPTITAGGTGSGATFSAQLTSIVDALGVYNSETKTYQYNNLLEWVDFGAKQTDDLTVADTIFNTNPATHATVDGFATWKSTAQGYALGRATFGSGLSFSGGVLSATGGTDGNGIYSGSGTLANHTTRARIPDDGKLLFSQTYNTTDSAYFHFINGLDGNREIRGGLTDTASTGYSTFRFYQDEGDEEMGYDLRSLDNSGNTRVLAQGGSLRLIGSDIATLESSGEVRLLGLVKAKQEAYNEITSTSSPQTLSNTYSDNLINQGGTQATFTLNMPASPDDGQVCTITFNNAISTLTIDGNGETIVGSAVTTGVPGSQRKFKFYSGIGWIKLY